MVEEEGKVWSFNEGCLSIPGIREDVNRHEKLTIKYYDENWEYKEEVLDGVKARVIQHEYDHLDGVLFVDKIAPIRKRLLKNKLAAMAKGKFKADYKVKMHRKKSY